MERVGPWSFREAASPELELTFHEVQRAAREAARTLVNAWGKRSTTESIDSRHDTSALLSVVDLEARRDSLPDEVESMPFLPEAPPSWESGRTLTGELDDLRDLLPFADDELVVLRTSLTVWKRSSAIERLPEIADPELFVKWQGWLREPPDDHSVQRVRPDALATHVLCLRLREATKTALLGRPRLEAG
jgi:hypothetical protein